MLVKQLRQDAKDYAGVEDENLPLSQVFARLAKSKSYKKKRDEKASQKELDEELKSINQSIAQKCDGSLGDLRQLRTNLKRKIKQLKQVMGLDSRLQQKDQLSLAEID